MFAGNVAHNLCCQIQTDDNSSTYAFKTGKSVLFDGTSVTIILCLHVLIAHRKFIDYGINVDYFQWM